MKHYSPESVFQLEAFMNFNSSFLFFQFVFGSIESNNGKDLYEFFGYFCDILRTVANGTQVHVTHSSTYSNISSQTKMSSDWKIQKVKISQRYE